MVDKYDTITELKEKRKKYKKFKNLSMIGSIAGLATAVLSGIIFFTNYDKRPQEIDYESKTIYRENLEEYTQREIEEAGMGTVGVFGGICIFFGLGFKSESLEKKEKEISDLIEEVYYS